MPDSKGARVHTYGSRDQVEHEIQRLNDKEAAGTLTDLDRVTRDRALTEWGWFMAAERHDYGANTDAEFDADELGGGSGDRPAHADTQIDLGIDPEALKTLAGGTRFFKVAEQAAPWRLDGLLSPGLAILAGTTNVGKSTILTSLACDWAARRPKWADSVPITTERRGVLYISAEDWQPLIAARMVAWIKAYPEIDWLEISAHHEDNWHAAIHVAGLRLLNLQAVIKLIPSNVDLGLIVVDTYAAVAGVTDLNDEGEVEVVASHLRSLARFHDCTIVLAAHPAKQERIMGAQLAQQGKAQFDPAAPIRGSTRLADACDTILFLAPGEDDRHVVLTSEKQRLGPKGKPMLVETVIEQVAETPGAPEITGVAVKSLTEYEPPSDGPTVAEVVAAAMNMHFLEHGGELRNDSLHSLKVEHRTGKNEGFLTLDQLKNGARNAYEQGLLPSVDRRNPGKRSLTYVWRAGGDITQIQDLFPD